MTEQYLGWAEEDVDLMAGLVYELKPLYENDYTLLYLRIVSLSRTMLFVRRGSKPDEAMDIYGNRIQNYLEWLRWELKVQ